MFIATKKKAVLKNFQGEVQRGVSYPHRLNFYSIPPEKEITLEEFELWAIDRLYGTPWQPTQFYGLWVLTHRETVLGEIESSLYRNKSQKDMEVSLKPLFEKYMPLNSNTAHGARGAQVDYERQKDHYSHFILRLAFCRSYWPGFRRQARNRKANVSALREELRRRFIRSETVLFR